MKESKNYIDRVHEVTRLIPKGRVTNYGSIADYLALGSARMVGWALAQIPLFTDDIPAHRVLNRKGELSGRNNFPTPETMKTRLEAEGVLVMDWKVVNYKEIYWHPEALESDSTNKNGQLHKCSRPNNTSKSKFLFSTIPSLLSIVEHALLS